MKKKKITYGVWGMMEYQAVVKVGRRSVSVRFADGAVSAMGVNPAKFTTDNIILQNAVEASEDFRRGLIKVYSVQELDEELKVLRNSGEEVKGTEKSEESEKPEKVDVEISELSEAPAPTDVEFSNKEEARDYLVDTWGVNRAKLRTRDDIINAGKAFNVNIYFVN